MSAAWAGPTPDAWPASGIVCERDNCGVAVRWLDNAGVRSGRVEEVSTDAGRTWARGPRASCGTDTRERGP